MKVHDCASLADGSFYLVMERLRGESLAALLEREGRLSWERTLEIVRGLAEALDEAHALGIVHRDLKPENVMLSVDAGGRELVKLVDFGIARLERAEQLTMVGRVMGTPEYMSPEQCVGTTADGRADVYALGALAYRCLTGRLPFEADSFMGLVTQHLTETPPSPSSLAPLDARVDAVLLRALAKDRDARHASAGELLRELAGTPAPGAPRKAPSVRPRRPLGRRRSKGMGLILAVVGAAMLTLTVAILAATACLAHT